MGRVPGFVKWVVSPALAALLGYGVIGPRLAGHKEIVRAVQDRVSKVVPLGEPEKPSRPSVDEPAKEVPPPGVSVTAKPIDEAPKPSRRRRRRPRIAPSDEAPPESSPSPDRGGPDPASTP